MSVIKLYVPSLDKIKNVIDEEGLNSYLIKFEKADILIGCDESIDFIKSEIIKKRSNTSQDLNEGKS